jgi:succinyl-diaminopimelate desuccinylase
MSRVVELTQDLIARASVTPEDAGCQSLLANQLQRLDFKIEHHRFGQVDNLWARRGQATPLLVFLGHTDVVPTGPVEQWQHPPFAPIIKDGYLYGRGTSDMKGSIAAFIVAIEQFLEQHPKHAGSIAVMLTSDEEGPSIDGVKKLVEVLEARQEKIDYCVVGEPTCEEHFGDIVKVGRRGSLTGYLKILGKQGHIAFPQMADNPIHRSIPALLKLQQEIWDNGNADFQPTSFQISNIHAGTGANNIIPGELDIQFNFRYSTAVTEDILKTRVDAILKQEKINYKMQWITGALPFLTKPGKLRAAAVQAIKSIANIDTNCTTVGGTSDGRFIAPTGAEVVEIGPRTTAHQIDERVPLQDLEQLVQVYQHIMQSLLT